VQYDTFIEYLKGIGIHYLQFNEEDFESYLYDEKICAEILEDCRLGGTFGYDAAERAKFYQLYTHRRFLAQNGTEKEYKKLMNKWTFPGIRLLLFGLPDILKQSYPYCKKHPILLPVAVVHRWIDFILQLMRKEAKVSTYLKYKEDVSDQESIQKRLDLIEEMKMI